MSNNPAKIPSYLSFDATSLWHISALQITGIESMTMSSRLKAGNGRQGTLQDLEETINRTGKRRLAKFEMSVADPDVLLDKAAEKAEEKANPSKTGRALVAQDAGEDDNQLGAFDIDFFSKDYRMLSSKHGKKEHVFGRVDALRGEWDMSNEGGCDPRDRFGLSEDLMNTFVMIMCWSINPYKQILILLDILRLCCSLSSTVFQTRSSV
jgi:hypothetical protein